jgi:hypothetical protein
MRSQWIRNLLFAGTSLLGLVAPPAWSTTEGLRLEIEGLTVVEVFQGNVSGEVSGFIGELSEPIDVVWLDENMSEFVPAGADSSLGLSIDDPSIVQIDLTGPWTFTALGLEHGETTFTLQLRRLGVPQYMSPPIPVHIEEEAVGVVVLNQGYEIARVVEDQVSGSIRIGAGRTTQDLDVFFLAKDGDFLDLETEGGFGLRWLTADSTIAGFTSTGDFSVGGEGHSIGTTSVSFKIFHVDHVDFSATPIPVEVVAATGTGDDDLPAAPRRTVLHPAVPNPFNPTTTLRYDLARDGRVRISIHDGRGRRVRELLDAPQRAGRHELSWNAAGLGSGTYIVRLAAPDHLETRKLTLIQ